VIPTKNWSTHRHVRILMEIPSKEYQAPRSRFQFIIVICNACLYFTVTSWFLFHNFASSLSVLQIYSCLIHPNDSFSIISYLFRKKISIHIIRSVYIGSYTLKIIQMYKWEYFWLKEKMREANMWEKILVIYLGYDRHPKIMQIRFCVTKSSVLVTTILVVQDALSRWRFKSFPGRHIHSPWNFICCSSDGGDDLALITRLLKRTSEAAACRCRVWRTATLRDKSDKCLRLEPN